MSIDGLFFLAVALVPFAVRIVEAPISPMRIVELIEAAGAAAPDLN